MTEPTPGLLRPTPMKLTSALGIPALLLLAVACGQTNKIIGVEGGPPSNVGSCAVDSPAITDAPVVAGADLDGDGDGKADQIRLTAADEQGCASRLVTTLGGRTQGVSLGELPSGARDYSAVSVPGRKGQLLVMHETHPRGGFQNHLYGYAGGRFGEIFTEAGAPVLPFVTTDTKGGYLSVSCTDDGLQVQRAVAHTPPGVVFAWDVEQTSYRLNGLVAMVTDQHEVKDNVLDNALAKDYPALVTRDAFKTGCAG